MSAAKAAAGYLAPYVSRLDRMEQSGVNNYQSKIIAASVKNSNQVKELIRLGIDAITLKPEIIVQAPFSLFN